MAPFSRVRCVKWLALLLAFASACTVSSRSGPPPEPGPHRATAAAEQPAPASTGSAAARPAQPSSEQVPIEADDAVWGSPLAPVTLVEFSDLQCPFCARAQATLSRVAKLYGPGKLRIVFKHQPLPFHRAAREAADFSQAVTDSAGSEAAFAFMQLCLSNQASLGPDTYRRYLAQLGLDAGATESRARDPDVIARVQRDIDLATRLGATGTPTFFVNGVAITGAQPLESFTAAVEAELEKAAKLRAAGTAPERVYAALVAANFKAPEPSATDTEAPDLQAWQVPLGRAPQRGARHPLVTIVAFYDYECPFCKRVQPALDELLSRYPDDVRLVVRHNPLGFHPRAAPAAELAIEARVQRGDAAFFDVSKRLFERSPSLSEEALLEIAGELGLDRRRVRLALHKRTHTRVIEEDADLAADLRARGVPHFFVNGVRLAGAQPLEKFVEAVERERERALSLVRSGTPRVAVYDELMKAAKPPEPPERKEVSPGQSSPARGPANAAYVIEIFSDFECPFCKRVQPTLDELDRRYPGQIRWVWRHLPLPFHRNAQPAAVAAMEARAQRGDAGFWAMHDALFEAQGDEDGLSEGGLLAIAERLNLDLVRFRAALENGVHGAAIDADTRAASDAGITGTPAFTINGYFLSGAQPIEAFEKLIQYAKRNAKARRAAGAKK